MTASSTWRACTWGDIATLEYGKGLRDYEAKENGAYPVYGTNGMIGWHSEPLSHGPGVIIGRKGAYRGVHYSKQPFFVIDTAFYLKPKEDLDLHWAYYQLRTQDINGMDSGSAIPSTSRGDFYHLPVKVPPLPEQQAIAATLGALDDKIELNRRMNQTLEDLGRTLFQAWFVDFAPVRAKCEGRTPEGMDAETAALFPAEFQDSPLGPMPKGWETGRLGQIALSIRLGVEPGDVPVETPYIGLEHMPRRNIALADWGRAGDVGSGKSRFNSGDILFGKLRPYFHKVGVAPVDGVCSTDIVVVRPHELGWQGFTLFHVSSTEFVNYTDSHSAGTKMPRTNWQDMARYEIAQPPIAIAEAFNDFVQPLVSRIQANVAETHTLAALRDTLLPKLLSGEVRVMEARGEASGPGGEPHLASLQSRGGTG